MTTVAEHEFDEGRFAAEFCADHLLLPGQAAVEESGDDPDDDLLHSDQQPRGTGGHVAGSECGDSGRMGREAARPLPPPPLLATQRPPQLSGQPRKHMNKTD